VSLRRAIRETLDDGRIEIARRTGLWARNGIRLGVARAILRLLLASRLQFTGGHPMRHLTGDVRHAFQRLRRAPLFAGIAVVILALVALQAYHWAFARSGG